MHPTRRFIVKYTSTMHAVVDDSIVAAIHDHRAAAEAVASSWQRSRASAIRPSRLLSWSAPLLRECRPFLPGMLGSAGTDSAAQLYGATLEVSVSRSDPQLHHASPCASKLQPRLGHQVNAMRRRARTGGQVERRATKTQKPACLQVEHCKNSGN